MSVKILKLLRYIFFYNTAWNITGTEITKHTILFRVNKDINDFNRLQRNEYYYLLLLILFQFEYFSENNDIFIMLTKY